MLWLLAVPPLIVSIVLYSLRKHHPSLNLCLLPFHVLLLAAPMIPGILPGMEFLPAGAAQLSLWALVLNLGQFWDTILLPACWIGSAVFLALPVKHTMVHKCPNDGGKTCNMSMK